VSSNHDNAKFNVSVAGEAWVQAKSFANAGPHDKVFVIDPDSGTVTFGDGMHGQRPPTGSSIKIAYETSDGVAGSVTVSTTFTWPPKPQKFRVALTPQGVTFQQTDPVAEELSGEKRLTYYFGQLLGADDFRDEQNYFLRKHRRHNQKLHGYGIVTGLDVTVNGKGADATLVVSPGYAIDPYGNELIVNTAICVKVGDRPSPQFVSLEYIERLTDPEPGSPTDPGMADQPLLRMSRIAEGVSVSLSSTKSDALIVARLSLKGANWQIDRTFKPRRIR
jgi:hypothetical protein